MFEIILKRSFPLRKSVAVLTVQVAMYRRREYVQLARRKLKQIEI
jgi:hypothetical protein